MNPENPTPNTPSTPPQPGVPVNPLVPQPPAGPNVIPPNTPPVAPPSPMPMANPASAPTPNPTSDPAPLGAPSSLNDPMGATMPMSPASKQVRPAGSRKGLVVGVMAATVVVIAVLVYLVLTAK